MTFKHDSGRRAKYLEGPMTAEKDTAMQIIANSIKSEL